METRYFYVPDTPAEGTLPAEEAAHAVKVLRLKPGDELMLMDGNGTFYQAAVVSASQHQCAYRVLHELPQPRQWQPHLHLAIAPTKLTDRMEWLVEKAVEIGVDEISFLECQYSERRQLKMPRLEKIAVSAMKQSHKAWKPVLNDLVPFESFVAAHTTGSRFIAHCYANSQRFNLWQQLQDVTADTLVMVGPEGDFSPREVEQAVNAGFVPADLGKSRLRTETAGLSAVMMMQLRASQVSIL